MLTPPDNCLQQQVLKIAIIHSGNSQWLNPWSCEQPNIPGTWLWSSTIYGSKKWLIRHGECYMAGCQWPTVPCRNCFADVVCSSSGEACWQCCGVFCLWLWVWSLCTVHGNGIKLNFDSHKLFCRDMMYITSGSFVKGRLIDFELWCYGTRYAQGVPYQEIHLWHMRLCKKWVQAMSPNSPPKSRFYGN